MNLRISRRVLVAIVGSTSLAIPLALAGCGGGGGAPPSGGTGLPATASAARGALLYDEWWTMTGGSVPTTTHPAYPAVGTQTGSATWSCAECHGWDYKGASGKYATGPHHTGIAGVLPSAGDAPDVLFAAIQGTGTTHDFGPYFGTDDLWDLVAFVKSGTSDPNPWVNPTTGAGLGNATNGAPLYTANCASCHGANGATIDLGGGQDVGDRALSDPWEVLHQIRWGIPGTAMPSMHEAGLTETQQAAILAYAQTLTGAPPPPPPPAQLSYATDIKPIWVARSCTGCHGSSGGLTLSGTTAASYAELFEATSTGRVNTTTPSASKILTKPATIGVSHGGGKIFATGTADADYQKILTWITQGAKNN